MAGMPRYLVACLHSGGLALLAILVSGGIVLQVLACALYNNWWPMLTVVMYVLLPMPLLFFGGSDSSSLMSGDGNSWVKSQTPQRTIGALEGVHTVVMYVLLPMPLLFFGGSDSSSLMSGDGNSWVNFTKFLTGASVVGSFAIPSILKHADVIGWGALWMELSSFFIFGIAILWFLQMNNEEEYSMF